MLTTDCGFLENELMDVVRLFKSRPQSVTHAFRFDGGVFFRFCRQNLFPFVRGGGFIFSHCLFFLCNVRFIGI